MCVTDLDPTDLDPTDLDPDLDLDLDITEDEQAPGVAWGQAGKYAGVAWGQLGRQDDYAHDEDTEEETETVDTGKGGSARSR
jgi:hypothetical protein